MSGDKPPRACGCLSEARAVTSNEGWLCCESCCVPTHGAATAAEWLLPPRSETSAATTLQLCTPEQPRGKRCVTKRTRNKPETTIVLQHQPTVCTPLGPGGPVQPPGDGEAAACGRWVGRLMVQSRREQGRARPGWLHLFGRGLEEDVTWHRHKLEQPRDTALFTQPAVKPWSSSPWFLLFSMVYLVHLVIQLQTCCGRLCAVPAVGLEHQDPQRWSEHLGEQQGC